MKRLSNQLNKITSFHGNLPHLLTRFNRAIITSWSIFPLELLILFLLTEELKIFYMQSAIVAFIIVASLEYYIGINWSFKETKTKLKKGYPSFLIVNCLRLIATILLLSFFVEKYHINYVISMMISSLIVYPINFLLCYLIIFNMKNHLFKDFYKTKNCECHC